MMLFFTVLGATALGTFSANAGLLWVLGSMAKKQQEAQQQELAKLQAQFLEMRQKEAERMHRYAKMES